MKKVRVKYTFDGEAREVILDDMVAFQKWELYHQDCDVDVTWADDEDAKDQPK